MMSVKLVVCMALFCGVCTATFNFVSIGDWGCVPIGGYHEQDELIVAKQFSAAATALNARFVLNTGDNFYYCGVHSKTDAMWASTFENVFTAESTMVPWYSCLGNHDYGYPGSAEAQMEYVSPNNNRWYLPARYYYKRLTFPGEVNISLLVLDASPCQSEYTSSNPKGWDPCGSVIPGCPGCTFHANVIAQSCSAQLAWMNQMLPTVPADDWKIVMVHAPASSIDVEDFLTPLQAAGFHFYINGHVHIMSHYTMDNAGTYITTGAACMVRVPQSESAKAAGSPNVQMPEVKWTPSSCTNQLQGHTCQNIFTQTIAGYTTHSFSADFQTLYTYIYDYAGHLLHTATTPKSGSGSSSSGPAPPQPPTPPTPDSSSSDSPPSPPTPASGSSSGSGNCCYYEAASCHSGQTCCNKEGHMYTESTCKGSTGQHHHCQWTGSSCVVY